VRKRVLIVEDDAEIIQVLQEFFAALEHGHDYEIETATDGVKAMPLLRRAPFDLVLLDMRMPRMDGLELLKKMHHDNIRVPVLMVTANEDAEAAGEALSAGVFAYVPKPFDLPRLEHLVALALSGGPPADDPPST
jgi:CheY-like chemotaxis protein